MQNQLGVGAGASDGASARGEINTLATAYSGDAMKCGPNGHGSRARGNACVRVSRAVD